MTDRVIVGAIGGSFGVHGEVGLKPFCAEREAIGDYTPLYTEEGRAFAQVVLTGQLKNGYFWDYQRIHAQRQAKTQFL